MPRHATATREEWLAARRDLLDEEKVLTRQSDALARKRRNLPWLRIEKEYRFDTDDGEVGLAELFGGRSQLLVYHFMYGPDYTAGCPSCSSIADGFDGIVVHLQNHDVAFQAVSRAPLATLAAYKRRMGWRFPWASSFGGDFNFDFAASFTASQQRDGAIEYNLRREPPLAPRSDEPLAGASVRTWERDEGAGPVAQMAAMTGTDVAAYTRERPGLSAFAIEDGVVYQTYTAHSRGLDALWGVYAWLDRAPLGRNETGVWMPRRDEYARPRS